MPQMRYGSKGEFYALTSVAHFPHKSKNRRAKNEKILMILMIVVGVSSVAFGQTKMSKDAKTEAQIIALEKAGWEAWKNKDAAWYRANTIDEAIWITGDGLFEKAPFIKDLTQCDVKSFSLDNFKVVMLSKDAAAMTYTVKQDGICYGKQIPAQVRAMVNYVRRGGKWLEAMYMETPMAQ